MGPGREASSTRKVVKEYLHLRDWLAPFLLPIQDRDAAVLVERVDVDFHNEDETGYVWTWLSEARDPSVIAADRIVVVGDDDAIAMARLSRLPTFLGVGG